MADVVIINKIDSAEPGAIEAVRAAVAELNPRADILTARSDLNLVGPSIEGKRVVVVEDGPTLTHGGMSYGAGIVAARRFGASRIIDPRPAAVGSIRDVLDRYPTLEPLVPAMGYGPTQMQELAATLNACDADIILSATPIDLTRVLDLERPVTRVRYELAEASGTPLAEVIEPIVRMTRTPAVVGATAS
jgi:predicted GTPase